MAERIETIVLRAPAGFRFPAPTGTRTIGSTLESIAAGGNGFGLDEVTVEKMDLNAVERAQIEDEPGTLVTAPQMPFTLIQPMSEAATAVATGAVPWGIEAIGAANAPQTAGAGVTVAVLDTGIIEGWKTHDAFKNVAIETKNFTGETPHDMVGHGTHCAGTIFGHDVGSQRIGIARGVSRVLIGKVLAENGGSTETIYRGMMWALSEHAHVISMSLGIDFPGYERQLMASGHLPEEATSIALEGYRACIRMFDLISRMVTLPDFGAASSIVVAAAGNESRRPDYAIAVAPPAVGESFVSVGALERDGTTEKYKVARFSNHSPRITAPGVGILSVGKGGTLQSMSGTSMATPHVAGIAALWAEQDVAGGNFSARHTIRQMENAADPVPYLSRRDVGHGLANAP